MEKIWANRLIGGTKTWAEVPTSRKTSVKTELASRMEKGIITMEQYKEILGTDAESEVDV